MPNMVIGVAQCYLPKASSELDLLVFVRYDQKLKTPEGWRTFRGFSFAANLSFTQGDR